MSTRREGGRVRQNVDKGEEGFKSMWTSATYIEQISKTGKIVLTNYVFTVVVMLTTAVGVRPTIYFRVYGGLHVSPSVDASYTRPLDHSHPQTNSHASSDIQEYIVHLFPMLCLIIELHQKKINQIYNIHCVSKKGAPKLWQ